jgi:hypothetical protein
VVVAPAKEHWNCAPIGEGIREHHAPTEATITSRVGGFDYPSFCAIEREFMAFETVPSINRFRGEMQVDRRSYRGYDFWILPQPRGAD